MNRMLAFLLMGLSLCTLASIGCAPQPRFSVDREVSKLPAGNLSKADDFADYWILYNSARLGMSEEALAGILVNMPNMHKVAETNRYLNEYPYCELLPYTNNALCSEWASSVVRSGGNPDVVFAIFSASDKKQLVELFWFNQGHVSVMLNGEWNHFLMSLKKGDSIRQVFSKLGKRDCTYSFDENNEGHAHFTYQGYDGRFYAIEVHASDGLITFAGVSII